MQLLFACNLVRHDQERAVALAGADERKPEPGIAGGRLDNGAAGREPAVSFRRLDHRARRPVFERARGVCALELEKEAAEPAVDARDFDQRRVADEIEDRVHGPPLRSRSGRWTQYGATSR